MKRTRLGVVRGFIAEFLFSVAYIGDDGRRISEVLTEEGIKDYSPGEELKPLFVLDEFEMQDFIDRLWDMGLRPTQMKEHLGAVPAMKEHIADLRKLNDFFMENWRRSAEMVAGLQFTPPRRYDD